MRKKGREGGRERVPLYEKWKGNGIGKDVSLYLVENPFFEEEKVWMGWMGWMNVVFAFI